MRLSRTDDTVWTGVVISDNGEILTTSEALGAAPVVDIRLWDGTEGHACVTGRDDDIGLALLAPLIEPARTYDYLALSSESPSIGQQLELLQYSFFTPTLDRRTTTVVEREPSDNGYGYMRIDTSDRSTADGAVLVNESGSIQGMRMPALWLLQNEIANPGEVGAIDAPAIASVALPSLRSGRMHILVRSFFSELDAPPPLPIIFTGEITIDGSPAPVGTLVHARVSKEGHPDHWQSTPLGVAGEYVLPVSAELPAYIGGTVEFWVDCKRSLTTTAYEDLLVRAVEQDLAF